MLPYHIGPVGYLPVYSQNISTPLPPLESKRGLTEAIRVTLLRWRQPSQKAHSQATYRPRTGSRLASVVVITSLDLRICSWTYKGL